MISFMRALKRLIGKCADSERQEYSALLIRTSKNGSTQRGMRFKLAVKKMFDSRDSSISKIE